jgi:hypothetical protein
VLQRYHRVREGHISAFAITFAAPHGMRLPANAPNLRPPDTMSDLDSATLEALRHVSTATLTTQLFKRGLRNTFMQGVAPLAPHSGANLVGPAFTLRNIQSREDIDVLELFANPLQKHFRSPSVFR